MRGRGSRETEQRNRSGGRLRSVRMRLFFRHSGGRGGASSASLGAAGRSRVTFASSGQSMRRAALSSNWRGDEFAVRSAVDRSAARRGGCRSGCAVGAASEIAGRAARLEVGQVSPVIAAARICRYPAGTRGGCRSLVLRSRRPLHRAPSGPRERRRPRRAETALNNFGKPEDEPDR